MMLHWVDLFKGLNPHRWATQISWCAAIPVAAAGPAPGQGAPAMEERCTHDRKMPLSALIMRTLRTHTLAAYAICGGAGNAG